MLPPVPGAVTQCFKDAAMNFLQSASLLIMLAGAFGAMNYLFLKLPSAIGILVVALLASFGIMGLDLALPALVLQPFRSFSRGVMPIMTRGGLKGGISVALALSLPEGDWKPQILTATYMVVIFSIIVQGLTVTRLANRFGREPDLV